MALPQSRGSRIYLVQLLIVAVALVIMLLGWWREGVILFGISFLAAAAFRVVVPPDHTGMLRVRGKVFDIVWMTILGASLIVLAISIPLQPV